ncbi:MAG TPA: adenylate/guanylate cyclase domain-containing protein [Gemmataceae bacterium]|nr:adenylate/guanylate cyclase domain-containing protein [Gemmataceae bacterium]
MSAPIHICVFDQQRQVFAGEFNAPVELGRQDEGELPPTPEGYARRLENGRYRLIIARHEEISISRKHALIEPISRDTVRITNLSLRASIGLPGGTEIWPNASRLEPLPIVLSLGAKTVRIQPPAALPLPDPLELQGLPEATRPPGSMELTFARFPGLPFQESDPKGEALFNWLKSTMEVLQSAASSEDFFDKAAQALVDVVGLHTGCVLLWDGKDWTINVIKTAPSMDIKPDWRPSRKVLNRVLEVKGTNWQRPGQFTNAASLSEIKSVVAAPILDRQGRVIGALYGDRRLLPAVPPITKLEAMLVELLAVVVAAGLTRIEQEKAALAARIQFEQFFTPDLARQLASQPQLLDGRDCEVSVLVADISGFSRISERLGPTKTVEWINDVLGALSKCVLDHQGVLVDYTGDEVMAMWGAPKEQPDHARLACRTALAMLNELPRLDRDWKAIVDEPLRIGIGINSGPARVGNVGSRYKFKYGPQGNTVNLASRVQGATKYLKVRVLITGAVQAQLDDSFCTRRLCKVRVVNIASPIDLYELAPPSEPGWDQLKQGYERALEMFEIKHFRTAASLLGSLLARNLDDDSSTMLLERDDGPSLVLIERIVNALREGPSESHPVWQLPGK